MQNFKVIIVEDVPLELKGTLGIIRNDIPEAEVIGTADSEPAYWKLLKQQKPDLLLLDLGLGGSSSFIIPGYIHVVPFSINLNNVPCVVFYCVIVCNT